MPRPPRWTAAILSLAPILLAAGLASARRRDEPDPPDAGLPRFVLGDFGGVTRATLETNALPYKVVATALLLREERVRGAALGRGDLPGVFRQFGFLLPERIGNWPATVPAPHFDRPLGMVSREVRGPTALVRVDAVNLGCATCHAGVLYDANGRATTTAWAGLPNTSLNLEAYTQAVYLSLASAMRDPGAFRARIAQLFPETGRAEQLTLRFFLLPRVGRRIRELQTRGLGPLAFSNGGAGRTNGVAALKAVLDLPLGPPSGHAEVGFVSTPDLSSRGLRSSLLADGVYAPLGAQPVDDERDSSSLTPGHVDSLSDIAAFFTAGTMGMRPDAAERALPAVRPVFRWLATRYASPAFPGAIDSARMREGERSFRTRCAKCHGTYGEGRPRRLVSFPNALIEQETMGTDSARWTSVDSTLLHALGASAHARHMRARRSGGYVPPVLSGVWATAPYLHNGSVPTLWQLLTPGDRPERFLVGGHALDYRAVGIAGATWTDGVFRYPAGYVPFAIPELVDTRAPGMSRAGHESPSRGMSAAEKWAVIEYLKTL